MTVWKVILSLILADASVTDIKSRRIGKKTVLLLAALGAVRPDRNGSEAMRALFFAVLIFAALFVVYALSKGGALGGGDVRLLSAEAFILQEEEMAAAMLCTAAALLLFSIVRRRGPGRHDGRIPAAPFISFGILASFFVTKAVKSCLKM